MQNHLTGAMRHKIEKEQIKTGNDYGSLLMHTQKTRNHL
jgi:hypothetical protein